MHRQFFKVLNKEAERREINRYKVLYVSISTSTSSPTTEQLCVT